MAIVHYTAMASAEDAARRLSDPEAQVSCHWLIGADGGIWRLVDEGRRAWHAGLGRWGGVADVNSNSVGIELDHPGTGPFPDAQITALERLLAGIVRRHPLIAPERVLGHSDVAIGRKIDPGPCFPWRRLALAGLSVWPEGAGLSDPAGFHADLDWIGYDWHSAPEARLAAFRMRFRPGHDGPLDAVDAGIARAVAERWPNRSRVTRVDAAAAGA
ncbi:N-acetylmuramoyl-L-alanine amidase [Hasllibacter halocynthiae]|uniref:N-acetylmuramoyl-L-alanine amidase n=2 Tax=Hasllibacter halocynthiae TaxID=595589 RepID=A0A2T0X6K2_9RHOB|nr:N-acetylmuramoyl-L-alanine amidase [Hasllibacter halocynthiae]PRY94553.1 N-acetylmuramoyl-L-alanine amidase [Hasllibacter halocynthiae]